MIAPVISREAFADRVGVSDDVVRGWSQRHWTKGVEFVVIGRITMINVEAADNWLMSHQESNSKAGATESEYTTRALGSRRLLQGHAISAI